MTAPPCWKAPLATGPVQGSVTMPGSKSLTNRLLLLAALADGPGWVREPLHSRDTELMAAALQALGTHVTAHEKDWLIEPAGWDGPTTLDVGNAGTAARFLTAAAGFSTGDVHLDGDSRMRQRPIAPLLQGLRALGVRVEDQGRGALPLTVHGTGSIAGGDVTIDASRSSQLLSALLLAAPSFTNGALIRHVGPPVPSTPHLVMTVNCLRAAGASVDDSVADQWLVAPATLLARDVTVEPDLSSASAFLGAAAVTAGEVTITGWPVGSTQPGMLMPGLLEAFGCSSTSSPAGLVIKGPERLHGADLDLRDHSEAATVLAVLAACASSPSRLRGIAHLRGHETDRLRALVEELSLAGAHISETPDGLSIEPARLHSPPQPLDPRADHRLAMAYAVLGLVVPGIDILDMQTVSKTVPEFTGMWAALVS